MTSYYKESTLTRNRLGLHFREALFNMAEQLFDIKQEAENGNSFYFTNKEKMVSKFVSMEVKDIEIAIPTDVIIDVTQEGSTEVAHKAKFAKTTYQLEQLFNRFCLKNCGEYQKDGSWERIKHHLKLLFEEYLGLDEKEIYKIVLHNEQTFTDLLNLSREEYSRIMAAKAKTTITDVKEYAWEVPEFRIYNNLFTEYDVEKTILDPLFLRQNTGFLSDSKNEFEFINYLEKCKQQIVWWYKNGVGSKSDFAISFVNSKNQSSLFFVDFAILFSDGTLGLFDPKTENSDPDMAAKHNALNDYISSRNQQGKATIGGIVIPNNGSWRYSKNKIEKGYDIEGWEVFNPLRKKN